MSQPIDKSRQAFNYKIFIYAALPCEAKPVVDYFKLKKDTSVNPFSVYSNNAICLTVTGVGKCAMSAGIAYTQALFSAAENPVLLNLGIAGHRDCAVGDIFLIDKIIDGDSGKNYYAPLVFTPPCATAAVQTASRPQLSYDHAYLCDMEASAFYDTATRFASAELVQCLKVISDNQSSPAENINPRQVSQLISGQIRTIEKLLTELSRLSGLVTMPESSWFAELTAHYHFTASERVQLKNRLNRWECLSGRKAPEFERASFKKGKDVLIWLEQQIDKEEFYL